MTNHNFINHDLDKAYLSALNYAQSHYENFPVVSKFLPKEIRKHVAIVYQFARQADDIADEGALLPEERIRRLKDYEQQLDNSINNNYTNGFWSAFAETIKIKKLTIQYFYNLLSAFKQDVVKHRYENFEEILNYCERSANPVGRIILELFDIRDKKVIEYSDAVCTALQLTNFYQDVKVDFQKERIYLPLNEMEQYGVSENLFEKKEDNANFQLLLKNQVERTEKLFEKGEEILRYLPLNLKFQIKLTILGGRRILEKIKRLNFNTLKKRPVLTKIDYIIILFRLIFN